MSWKHRFAKFTLSVACGGWKKLGTTSEKKNGKKDDIVQKGGRGLGKIHHF